MARVTHGGRPCRRPVPLSSTHPEVVTMAMWVVHMRAEGSPPQQLPFSPLVCSLAVDGGSAPQGRQERGREIPKRACCPEGQEQREKRSASCVFCSLAETPRRPSPHCPQREPVHRCPLISFPPLLYSLHSTPGLPGTISPKNYSNPCPKVCFQENSDSATSSRHCNEGSVGV